MALPAASAVLSAMPVPAAGSPTPLPLRLPKDCTLGLTRYGDPAHRAVVFHHGFGSPGLELPGDASLLGQPVHLLSPLVPSTYLLVGLAGVDFGAHQRCMLKWAGGTVLVMLVVSLLLGIIRL